MVVAKAAARRRVVRIAVLSSFEEAAGQRRRGPKKYAFM
jgi:hypothetical protein